jgi:hypothetical protein
MWIVHLIVNIIVFMYTINAASSKKSNIVHNIQSIFFFLLSTRKQMNLSIVSYRKLGINSVPYVNATKVAALIGRNVFEPKEKALLDFLKSANPQFSPLTSHACPCDTWQEYVRKNQNKKLSDQLSDAIKGESTSTSSLNLLKSDTNTNLALLSEKGAEIHNVIQDQAEKASRAQSDIEINEILKDTEDKVAKVAKEIEEYAFVDKNFVKETVLSCSRAVMMTRGNMLEESALNKMEEEKNVKSLNKKNISQRNTKMRYIRTNAFSVGGKIDGYDEDEDVVIEVKNRIRKTASCFTPYDSEIVQVTIYMKMMRLEGKACKAAIIREVFPDGSTKSTTIDWSEEEWKRIEDGLLLFCEEYAKLDMVKVDELIAMGSA